MNTSDTATQNQYLYSEMPVSAFYRYIDLPIVLPPLPSIFDETSLKGAMSMPITPVLEDANEEVASIFPSLAMSTDEAIPSIRELSKEQAKQEILALVNQTPGLDYFDIAMELDLDIDFTVSVCDELTAEGSILSQPMSFEDD